MASRRALQPLQRCLSLLSSSSSYPPLSLLSSYLSVSHPALSSPLSAFPPSLEPCFQPWLLTPVQHFARRPSKTDPSPYAWVKVGKDEPCPVSQPNKGSVKNRNHKKRMAQRDAFRKEQVQAQIKAVKKAKAKKKKAQLKRWKEGAERARAWAEKQAKLKETETEQLEAQQIVSSPL